MKRILIALGLLLIVPFATNSATIVIERVTTWSDGTPIPEELGNLLKYRYYYGESFTGPFTEGTLIIDNLTVLNVPEESQGTPSTGVGSFPMPGVPYYFTVDVESEGLRSLRAEPQMVAKVVEPPTPTRSSGCMKN